MHRAAFGIVCLAAWVVGLGGCAVVGPSSIRNGRGVYTDAIQQTNAEQTLKLIVGLRYAEVPTLLTVSSVTANMKFSGNVGAQFGVGPKENFAGNIIPLSGGASYEENPTISYTPAEGSKYLYKMLAPISLDMYLLLLDSGHGELVFRMFTECVNGLRNPSTISESNPKTAKRFEHLENLIVSLGRGGCIDWGKRVGEKAGRVVIVHDYAPDHQAEAEEFLHLCGMKPMPNGDAVTVPITLGIPMPGDNQLAIETRSLYRSLLSAAASIEVPSEHLENGLAMSMPERAPTCSQLAIRSSTVWPRGAALAVYYRGYWFYIDATDHQSRQAFQLLQSLLNAQMADLSGNEQRTPILTVPVGR